MRSYLLTDSVTLGSRRNWKHLFNVKMKCVFGTVFGPIGRFDELACRTEILSGFMVDWLPVPS